MPDEKTIRLGTPLGERTIRERGDHALESDTPAGEEYAGSSICLIPIRVEAPTLEEANAGLDVAMDAIRDALEQLPATMATATHLVPEVLEALEVTSALYREIHAAQIQQAHERARNN